MRIFSCTLFLLLASSGPVKADPGGVDRSFCYTSKSVNQEIDRTNVLKMIKVAGCDEATVIAEACGDGTGGWTEYEDFFDAAIKTCESESNKLDPSSQRLRHAMLSRCNARREPNGEHESEAEIEAKKCEMSVASFFYFSN